MQTGKLFNGGKKFTQFSSVLPELFCSTQFNICVLQPFFDRTNSVINFNFDFTIEEPTFCFDLQTKNLSPLMQWDILEFKAFFSTQTPTTDCVSKTQSLILVKNLSLNN